MFATKEAKMVKTISEQLRDYFKMVPPSAEKVAEVRKNWRKLRHPHMVVDIAVHDGQVSEIVTGYARNDNNADSYKK